MKNLRMVTDCLMTLVLLFLMGYQFWGDVAHEWAGVLMGVLFLLHQYLNRHWYRRLFQVHLTPFRILQVLINFLAAFAVIGLAISGAIMSNHVFTFLNLEGGMGFARRLHMAASHWGFVLIALHLGLHWSTILTKIKRQEKRTETDGFWTMIGPLIGAAIALYGALAFIWRDFPSAMFLRTQFLFLDFAEPAPLFYLDMLAIMGLFIFFSHYAGFLLRRTPKEKTVCRPLNRRREP